MGEHYSPLQFRRDARCHATVLAVTGGVAWLAYRWLPDDAGLLVLLGAGLAAAAVVLGLTLPLVGRRTT